MTYLLLQAIDMVRTVANVHHHNIEMDWSIFGFKVLDWSVQNRSLAYIADSFSIFFGHTRRIILVSDVGSDY